MKLALALVSTLFLLAGCSSDSGGGNNPAPCAGAACVQKPFAGAPVNLNGQWTGTGSIEFQGHVLDNLTFNIEFSQMPTGFDMAVQIVDQTGNPIYQTAMTGHTVRNNVITDVRDLANVGQLGSGGFILQRLPSYVQGIVMQNGQMELAALQDMGTTQMKFKAVVAPKSR